MKFKIHCFNSNLTGLIFLSSALSLGCGDKSPNGSNYTHNQELNTKNRNNPTGTRNFTQGTAKQVKTSKDTDFQNDAMKDADSKFIFEEKKDEHGSLAVNTQDPNPIIIGNGGVKKDVGNGFIFEETRNNGPRIDLNSLNNPVDDNNQQEISTLKKFASDMKTLHEQLNENMELITYENIKESFKKKSSEYKEFSRDINFNSNMYNTKKEIEEVIINFDRFKTWNESKIKENSENKPTLDKAEKIIEKMKKIIEKYKNVNENSSDEDLINLQNAFSSELVDIKSEKDKLPSNFHYIYDGKISEKSSEIKKLNGEIKNIGNKLAGLLILKNLDKYLIEVNSKIEKYSEDFEKLNTSIPTISDLENKIKDINNFIDSTEKEIKGMINLYDKGKSYSFMFQRKKSKKYEEWQEIIKSAKSIKEKFYKYKYENRDLLETNEKNKILDECKTGLGNNINDLNAELSNIENIKSKKSIEELKVKIKKKLDQYDEFKRKIPYIYSYNASPKEKEIEALEDSYTKISKKIKESLKNKYIEIDQKIKNKNLEMSKIFDEKNYDITHSPANTISANPELFKSKDFNQIKEDGKTVLLAFKLYFETNFKAECEELEILSDYDKYIEKLDKIQSDIDTFTENKFHDAFDTELEHNFKLLNKSNNNTNPSAISIFENYLQKLENIYSIMEFRKDLTFTDKQKENLQDIFKNILEANKSNFSKNVKDLSTDKAFEYRSFEDRVKDLEKTISTIKDTLAKLQEVTKKFNQLNVDTLNLDTEISNFQIELNDLNTIYLTCAKDSLTQAKERLERIKVIIGKANIHGEDSVRLLMFKKRINDLKDNIKFLYDNNKTSDFKAILDEMEKIYQESLKEPTNYTKSSYNNNIYTNKSNNKKNLETLGLKEGATQEEIRKAYRKLSLIHHPDKVTGADEKIIANKKFIEITQAYEKLIPK